MATPTRKLLVDVDDLATYLATTPRHVRTLVARRTIPYTKVGAAVRFDLNAVDRWLDANAVDYWQRR